jgi:MoaA/NifB/PqqE/SkfB family radical SAM enzyme
MDLILTYRCQNRCEHCYNEPRDLKELTVDQWKMIISKLWKIGIPHIVFTGGEPTLYPGLSDLIIKSEEFGQVTGLVTNGRNLRKPGFLKELIAKGLDHVQITVLSHREELHDMLVGEKGAWKETMEGLKIAVLEDVYLTTNTTIMRSNAPEIEETMRFLISLGVKHIAFNGIIRSGGGKETEDVIRSGEIEADRRGKWGENDLVHSDTILRTEPDYQWLRNKAMHRLRAQHGHRARRYCASLPKLL